jgi:hypothetical protein
MSITLTTAEELDQQKSKVLKERKRKLEDRNKNRNGNPNLAETEGLRVVKSSGKKRNQYIVLEDDNQVIDLKRIRKASDLVTE